MTGGFVGKFSKATLSTAEVARRFGKSPDTVVRYYQEGKLPLVPLPRPFGGHYRWTRESVESALRTCGAE